MRLSSSDHTNVAYRAVAVLFAILSQLNYLIAAPVSIPMTRYWAAGEGRRLSETGEVNLSSVQDMYYHGPLSVGNETFEFIFDTGSSLTWVTSSDCSNCEKSNSFNASAGRLNSVALCSNTSSNFSVEYGSGSVAGYLVSEQVSLGNLSVGEYVLGAATEVNFSDFDLQAYHGIVGLAWPALSPYGTPLVLSLWEEGEIDHGIFGMQLTQGGGQLTVGGLDSEAYQGDIHWLSLINNIWWEVKIDAWQVGANATKAVSDLNASAIIDSGTSLIVAPQQQVDAIVSALGHDVGIKKSGDLYFVRCALIRQLPSLTLFLNGGNQEGVILTIPGAALSVGQFSNGVCLLGIQGDPSIDYWIIGDPILRAFYTAYDYEQSRVGFAVAVNQPQPAKLLSTKIDDGFLAPT